MASQSTSNSMPSISVRRHIRWLPDGNAAEPTSTVVLTSSQNYYVDIRVIKPPIEPSAFAALSLDSNALPVSRLDWAFAGTTESTKHPRRQSSSAASNRSGSNGAIAGLTMTSAKERDGSIKDSSTGAVEGKEKENTKDSASHSGKPKEGDSANKDAATNASQNQPNQQSSRSKLTPIRQCTWHHWVDSRHNHSRRTHSDLRSTTGDQAPPSPTLPDDWKDAGIVYNGERDNETFERGSMPNSSTGQMQEYEELWRDLSPFRLPHESKIVSFVMTGENKILGTRGLIVRVGTWCQGVIRSGNDLGVERWRYGAVGSSLDGLSHSLTEIAPNEDRNCWERFVKIGDMSLPCHVTWEKCWSLKVGDEITSGGLKWEVKENYTWN